MSLTLEDTNQRVTAPLIASAGFALKAAIDYETAFAGVKRL